MAFVIYALIFVQLLLIVCLVRILIYLFSNVLHKRKTLPYLPTSKSVIHSIVESGILEGKENIVDLGSGTGTILAYLSQVYPEAKYIGVEKNGELAWSSRARFLFADNRPQIVQADMFNYDVSSADVIVGFWIGHLMPMLLKKFEKECKSGCIILSNRFALPDSEHFESRKIPNDKNKIYLYIKK